MPGHVSAEDSLEMRAQAHASFSCSVIIFILAPDTQSDHLPGGQIGDKLKYLCFHIFFSAIQ